jgi:hypothetical protein
MVAWFEQQGLLVNDFAFGSIEGAPRLTEAALRVLRNRQAGLEFESALAELFETAGFTVERHVTFHTPFGVRYADLVLKRGDELVGIVEAKLGNSAYTASQRAKDAYISVTSGIKTIVVRGPFR